MLCVRSGSGFESDSYSLNVKMFFFAKSNGYLISKVGLILTFRILTETAIYKGFEANDEFVKKNLFMRAGADQRKLGSAPLVKRWINDS